MLNSTQIYDAVKRIQWVLVFDKVKPNGKQFEEILTKELKLAEFRGYQNGVRTTEEEYENKNKENDQS